MNVPPGSACSPGHTCYKLPAIGLYGQRTDLFIILCRLQYPPDEEEQATSGQPRSHELETTQIQERKKQGKGQGRDLAREVMDQVVVVQATLDLLQKIQRADSLRRRLSKRMPKLR